MSIMFVWIGASVVYELSQGNQRAVIVQEGPTRVLHHAKSWGSCVVACPIWISHITPLSTDPVYVTVGAL